MVDILTIAESDKWHTYLDMLQSYQRDVYYTPEYYSLYENNGDGKAFCYVYREKENVLLYPFLMNSVNLVGYILDDDYYDIQGAYGYNGFVSSSKDLAFITHFHNSFDLYCKNNHIIAEFSRFHPLLNNQRLASPAMKLFCSRNTVKLDLSKSSEEIWMTEFSSKNRNVIRKALKDGMIIVESKDYCSFKQLYDQTMLNVHAEDFYFFPLDYYKDLQKNFGERVLLCFAMYDGKPIAGSIFMFDKYFAHYHLSGRNKNYYKIAANNAILWYGIQKAKEFGCKWFHFGGGTTGEANDKLLHFKRNFSKETGEFWIGKRMHNQEIYDEVVRQWKKNHPKSYSTHNVMLLGYRELKNNE